MSELQNQPPPGPPVAPPAISPSSLPEPLKGIPVPPAIAVLAVVVGLAFLVALFRFPRVISIGISYERAERKLDAGDAAAAADLLQPLAKEYPQSDEIGIKLIRACIQAGRYPEAAEELLKFDGRSVSKEDNEELSRLQSELEQKLPPDVSEGNKP